MCHEYVSSSKPAITKMAQMLAAYPENFNMEDPEVEMEVEVEVAEVAEVAEDSEKKAKEELCDDFMFAMEEDPEMYVAAGLPPPVTLPTSSALGLDATVKSVISSLGEMKGANVNIKVVVVSGNSNTTMHF
jgi:shikimate kinase